MITKQTMHAAIADLNVQLDANAPPELLEVFRDEQRALDQQVVPSETAVVGTAMPDGALLDFDGNPTTLAHARGSSAAVVVFYRGVWCPFCNVALHVYQRDLVPALAEHNIPLIAISPQKPDGAAAIRDKHSLTFTVLSDPGSQIASKLGILTAISDEARIAQAELGENVAVGNADGTYDVPMPAVVVVAADGTISWIDVHPNYAGRTEPAAIIDAVATLFSGRAAATACYERAGA